MEMSHLASKLKALRLELSKDLLVHLVLISPPTQFSQFKVSHNCQKDNWSLYELISHYVQEEDKIKQDKAESAHLTATSKDKKKNNKRKKDKEVVDTTPQKKYKEQSEDKCFSSVKRLGMYKESTLLNLVCYEVN